MCLRVCACVCVYVKAKILGEFRPWPETVTSRDNSGKKAEAGTIVVRTYQRCQFVSPLGVRDARKSANFLLAGENRISNYTIPACQSKKTHTTILNYTSICTRALHAHTTEVAASCNTHLLRLTFRGKRKILIAMENNYD